MIIACWVALPVIFIWTPIKTRQLRLIVASGVFLLTLCVSILHMQQAERNEFFLGWISLYAAAFSFALLRRNWGGIAMCEAGTRAEDIVTTSTRTLFELMAVSGLACSAASFWSTRSDMNAVILFASAAVVGLLMAVISIILIRFPLEAGNYRILKILLIWSVVAILYQATATLNLMLELALYSAPSQPLFTWFYVVFVGSAIASLIYVVLTLAIGYWLRWCGWRIERAPAPVSDVEHRFENID